MTKTGKFWVVFLLLAASVAIYAEQYFWACWYLSLSLIWIFWIGKK